MASERSSSCVTKRPALRITWASPSCSPSRPWTFSRASRRATIATPLADGRGRRAPPPAPKGHASVRAERYVLHLITAQHRSQADRWARRRRDALPARVECRQRLARGSVAGRDERADRGAEAHLPADALGHVLRGGRVEAGWADPRRVLGRATGTRPGVHQGHHIGVGPDVYYTANSTTRPCPRP